MTETQTDTEPFPDLVSGAARGYVAEALAGARGRRVQLLAHLAVVDVDNNPCDQDPRHALISEPTNVAARLIGAIRQYTKRFGPLV